MKLRGGCQRCPEEKFVLFPALLLLSMVLIFPCFSFAQSDVITEDRIRLEIFGKVLNSHNKGVPGVAIDIFVDGSMLHSGEGKKHEPVFTESDGSYQARFWIKRNLINHQSTVDVSVFKTSYAKTTFSIAGEDFRKNNGNIFTLADIKIQRTTGPAFWIAVAVFSLAYILISFELLHRTMAAMLGASLMLVITYTIGTLNPAYHIISYEAAIAAIDMNVIFLLMGMMILVGILKHTGIFQWCAYKCYQLARGNIVLLAIILMCFTAVASAFLDNVTTMLLLTPVTLEIAISLRIPPIALLMPEILASNIGGTATLIGDPPNIMIGSYSGIPFMEFVTNLAPTCAVALIILFVFINYIFGRQYSKGRVEDVDEFIAQLREDYKITDTTLLAAGLVVISIVIGLFLTHHIWHMEVSIAALFGASLLFTFGLLTKKVNMLELIEKDIEWTTLLFFVFLFMLVGGVEETGFLDIIADTVLQLSQGNLVLAICLILWVSAIMSAFVDNIPFTATMLPIVAYLTEVIPGAESGVLWWALAFGACFGGNGTMIGASANVVTLGIAESAGYPVSFFSFMKIAFPYMVVSVIVANVWLLIGY